MGIGIHNGGASFRDSTWQENGGVNVKEGIYIAMFTEYRHGIQLLEVGRDVTR